MKKRGLIRMLLLSSLIAGCSNKATSVVNNDSKSDIPATQQSVNVGNNTQNNINTTTNTSTKTNSKVLPESKNTKDSGTEKKQYKIGDTWTVEGQWAFTILGAEKTEERNQFSEKNPAAVYAVDFMYTNMGYKSDWSDGLSFFPEDSPIVDSKGIMGDSYPLVPESPPKATPVGATCNARVFIAVENEGAFTISLSKYDGIGNNQKATFYVEPGKSAEGVVLPEKTVEVPALKMGEVWTVDGQWTMTITGVLETQDRNQFSEKTPAAVYWVDYTYTNLGYQADYMDGLFFYLSDEMIVDSAGEVGYSYPLIADNQPKSAPIGATCNARACIAVEHAGDFKVTVTKYDGNGNNQTETFAVTVS